jgi:hypothetical protein
VKPPPLCGVRCARGHDRVCVLQGHGGRSCDRAPLLARGHAMCCLPRTQGSSKISKCEGPHSSHSSSQTCHTHTHNTALGMCACWCVRCCAVCCGAILPAVARCRRMRRRVECLRFASLISWRELCAMCADRVSEGERVGCIAHTTNPLSSVLYALQ